MKKIIFAFVALLTFFQLSAQESKTETNQRFMQITTIESVVGGGFGRSKMIITKEDGSQEERDMENLFSVAGLNLKNIKSNESEIMRTLKTYTDQGWKLVQAIPLTLSPNQNSNGIFMTRYFLSKMEEKKGF